jgi:hypothetical protein
LFRLAFFKEAETFGQVQQTPSCNAVSIVFRAQPMPPRRFQPALLFDRIEPMGAIRMAKAWG